MSGSPRGSTHRAPPSGAAVLQSVATPMLVECWLRRRTTIDIDPRLGLGGAQVSAWPTRDDRARQLPTDHQSGGNTTPWRPANTRVTRRRSAPARILSLHRRTHARRGRRGLDNEGHSIPVLATRAAGA